MKIYLVGGAVRDARLGLPVKERDWVVVGATPEEMVAQGYRPVGKDFPVFLHPKTQEEYALARTERKSGRGYHGFQFHTGPEVTLEDDLWRRDLTVNAMAQDEDGKLVDPHGGQRDLDARLLRHVSPAFAEDPVRILRIARFAARFASLGFRVADETMALMRSMVDAGEVDHLVAERVWKETERALMEPSPGTFFEVLHACGALARVMPELAALSGVPQRADYHPEVDTLVHTLMCVDAAVRAQHGIEVRIATLLHDLGKAATPKGELPSHRGHDMRGLPLVKQFCERLRVPNGARDLALMVTRDHLLVHKVRELRPKTLLELLERFDAFRKSGRFEQALSACECDARGRLGFEDDPYPQTDYLRAAAKAAAVANADVLADGFTGPAVGEEIVRRRLARLVTWKQSQT
ncbi:tRNA nucleotidyltransferase (CCA-adding enzyme) [Panacagrimonas perspica]|uniref:Multifunctional CCA protein n=1 Tax=Panacagrimonas perspica TaxID=381431 RepID=A0A4R7P5D8_9GAMM|nr:multifunctional CCA addition/repair protein [Panacagrimonas perspica]TDU28672.1 tRNA nucleotidyltransferase (CCA-adding enzyme) [Panacagrimonas perspica]THD05071.1 multifunctional CCA tRNA nucleotidyl transferase/2'3'-cyclic phosphodiesterase/2'nucleotidase/phosphatase [Panacagrimonas perspica]